MSPKELAEKIVNAIDACRSDVYGSSAADRVSRIKHWEREIIKAAKHKPMYKIKDKSNEIDFNDLL